MNEYKDLLGSIEKSLEILIKKNNDLMSKIPLEDQGKVTHISKDINTALKAAREGDAEQITKLTKKYASTNNIK